MPGLTFIKLFYAGYSFGPRKYLSKSWFLKAFWPCSDDKVPIMSLKDFNKIEWFPIPKAFFTSPLISSFSGIPQYDTYLLFSPFELMTAEIASGSVVVEYMLSLSSTMRWCHRTIFVQATCPFARRKYLLQHVFDRWHLVTKSLKLELRIVPINHVQKYPICWMERESLEDIFTKPLFSLWASLPWLNVLFHFLSAFKIFIEFNE